MVVAKSGENTVKNFLESKNMSVEKIPETVIKTADFKVYNKGKLLCFLEEKTIDYTLPAWNNEMTLYNSLAKHIYESIKQFKSINPGKVVPNVLSLTNLGSPGSIDDLFITLTGHIITSKGKMRSIDIMKRIEKDLDLIDLYLWFDKDQYTGYLCDDNQSSPGSKLARIIGLY